MISEPLNIDGSRGEGGGQILRTALSLAALSRQPVWIDHIRANRPKPGLRPQHLIAVRALAAITGAVVQGDRVDSETLHFAPGAARGGCHDFSINTAGSAVLVLSAMLPPLLFADAPSRVRVSGGTHVPFSPGFHYFNEIFLPMLNRMGAGVRASLASWGWYPAGGGRVEMEVNPLAGLGGISLTARGGLRAVEAVIGLSNLPEHVGEREQNWLEAQPRPANCRWQCRIDKTAAACPGNVVFLKAVFDHGVAGFSALGRKGKPAEQVAGEAWRDLLHFLDTGAAVDRYLADQLPLYMALAQGESQLTVEKLTTHLRTNIAVIETFLPVRFQVDEENNTIAVKGIGWGQGRVDQA